MSYCDFVKNLPEGEKKNLHKNYHDNFYGFAINDDNELFGRFILEINQAGLNWETILKKEQNFRNAFDNFDIQKIAFYGENDINRLLNDSGIIRNKLKISAVIYNAKEIIKLQQEFGSFKNWLYNYSFDLKEDWVKLFKKHFKFVGKEIVNEFLMSIGILQGAHDENCEIFKEIKEQKELKI